AQHADGDARRALNLTEAVWHHARNALPRGVREIDADLVTRVLERRIPRYDKSGEQHFNLISALHKAVRGSDVNGALYWLARMIDAGEDPLYIARRVVRMASEDIGLADPRALSLALAAKDAYHFLGSPGPALYPGPRARETRRTGSGAGADPPRGEPRRRGQAPRPGGQLPGGQPGTRSPGRRPPPGPRRAGSCRPVAPPM